MNREFRSIKIYLQRGILKRHHRVIRRNKEERSKYFFKFFQIFIPNNRSSFVYFFLFLKNLALPVRRFQCRIFHFAQKILHFHIRTVETLRKKPTHTFKKTKNTFPISFRKVSDGLVSPETITNKTAESTASRRAAASAPARRGTPTCERTGTAPAPSPSPSSCNTCDRVCTTIFERYQA